MPKIPRIPRPHTPSVYPCRVYRRNRSTFTHMDRIYRSRIHRFFARKMKIHHQLVTEPAAHILFFVKL